MLDKLQYVALTILWKESFGVLGQRFNINKNDRENTWQTVEKKAIDKVCMEHDTRVKFNKHFWDSELAESMREEYFLFLLL